MGCLDQVAFKNLFAGWWIQGQIVGTDVCGQRQFEVLRPRPTPLAGNVFESLRAAAVVVEQETSPTI